MSVVIDDPNEIQSYIETLIRDEQNKLKKLEANKKTNQIKEVNNKKQIQEKLQDIEIQNLTLSECVDFFKNYTLEELLEIPVEIKSYDDVFAKLQQAKKNEKDKKNLTRRYKENERKLMKLRLSLSR